MMDAPQTGRARPLALWLAGAALAISLAALAAVLVPRLGAGASDEAQRGSVTEIVREMLLKNPELVQEALLELERRNTTAQADAQRKVLAGESGALTNPATSVIAGNPQGDVTLIEFMDYNCGYCKRALDDVLALAKDDPKLRVVIKDFPILGPDSIEASRVAIAAKNQLSGEKYWAFHARLMATRGKINGAKATEIAVEAGADPVRLRADAEGAAVRAAIEDTIGLGDRLGLTGTPAFVIADEVVFGAVGAAALKARIDSVRKCGKTNCAS